MKGGKSFANAGFFAMRPGAATAAFWDGVRNDTIAAAAAPKRASPLQSAVNKRLGALPAPPAAPPGALRVALYPKVLVRSAQPSVPCLQVARVLRCAHCG
eukprot:5966226-Prymnesium_polylepis.1